MKHLARRWTASRWRTLSPGTGPLLLWALGLYGFLASPLFLVERVAVTGMGGELDPQLAAVREEVRARLVFLRHQHLLAVDAARAAAAVAQLPYVAEVRVTRQLPSTLAVQVRPRQAVAHFPYGAGFFEVDRLGRVLGPARQPPGSLPIISGALASGEAVAAGRVGPVPLAAAAMAAAAAGGVLGDRLSQVHVDGEAGRLVLFLSDGSRLIWGELEAGGLKEDFHRERARMLEALQGRLSGTRPFVLDLSDPSRAVWGPVEPGG